MKPILIKKKIPTDKIRILFKYEKSKKSGLQLFLIYGPICGD
jgi:hypothetical protein